MIVKSPRLETAVLSTHLWVSNSTTKDLTTRKEILTKVARISWRRKENTHKLQIFSNEAPEVQTPKHMSQHHI
jgi:hypothetical protein